MLSSAHATFFRIVHMLGLTISCNKVKRREIILRIVSDHNIMKLEIDYREKK